MTSAARLMREIPAKHTVYAVTYCPRGEMLAFGEGFWYGGGSVAILESDGGVLWSVPLTELLEPGWTEPCTASGLSFDASGRFLAISLWRWSQRYAPALLCRLEADGPRSCLLAYDSLSFREAIDMGNECIATGALLHEGRMLVRRSSARDEHVVRSHSVPSEVAFEQAPHHLTHSRVVAFDGFAATGVGGRLLLVALDESGAPRVGSVSSPDDVEITSVARSADGATLATGRRDGSVVWWRRGEGRSGTPELHVVATVPPDPRALRAKAPDGTHVYGGAAVVAACFLSDGRLITADASGRVGVWDGPEPVGSWRVPSGSPRSLAARPERPHVAVGCKAVGGGTRGGAVYTFELTA